MRIGRDGSVQGMSGAKAGLLAAGVWAAAEPLLGRVFRTEYSDVRLLGRAVTRTRGWPAAGIVLHLANGAVFGAAFQQLGLRGIRSGVIAAEAENLVLWPGMILADRIHPDRRSGAWPRLVTSPRIAAYEVAAHGLFGGVLGALTRRT
jgi:hypothetical protein